MHIPIIAFDFSMAKPAMCTFINENIDFYFWPANIDNTTVSKLSASGIHVNSRNLPKMKDTDFDEHTLIYEHVTRADQLSDMIVDTIKTVLDKNGINDYANVYVANEGFSFGSKGDAMLDLAGYKYILMYKLLNNGFTNLKTYAPITIKSTAGCAKRGMGKLEMINAAGLYGQTEHPFLKAISSDPMSLKKKTAFIDGVDDLCDAYWCMKTVLKKEFGE